MIIWVGLMFFIVLVNETSGTPVKVLQASAGMPVLPGLFSHCILFRAKLTSFCVGGLFISMSCIIVSISSNTSGSHDDSSFLLNGFVRCFFKHFHVLFVIASK